MTNLICIVCPRGCHLTVDEKNGYKVTGNGCPRGEAYGKNELINPLRTVTATVKIELSGSVKYCPVKTSAPIPKKMVMDSVSLLKNVTLKKPVKMGDIVLENTFDTGVNYIATKTMEA